MEINEGTYGKIRHILPVQCERVTVQNITFINALPYICENGCKRRRLPKEYGSRHVIYKRFNRRVRDGVTGRLFRLMQGFRRVFCRFEKLDVMLYIGFIQLALVYLSIK